MKYDCSDPNCYFCYLMRIPYQIGVAGDLPKEYMDDIRKSGGYKAWRDLALLENSRTFKGVELRAIRSRIYERNKVHRKTRLLLAV